VFPAGSSAAAAESRFWRSVFALCEEDDIRLS